MEAPAAAKNMLVGKGKGTAVEATRVPVPHFLNTFRSADTLPSPNSQSKVSSPMKQESNGGIVSEQPSHPTLEGI